jgi:hypothetical protein
MANATSGNNRPTALQKSIGGMGILLLAAVLTGSGGADISKPPKVVAPQRHIRTLEQLVGQALDLNQPAFEALRRKLAAGETQQAALALLEYFRKRTVLRDPQVQHWRESTDAAFVDYWKQDAHEFVSRYGKDGRINWRHNNNPPKAEHESFEIRNRLINLAGWTAAANRCDSSELRRKVVETFWDWYRDCPAPELPVSGWWDGHKTGFAWQEIEVALRGRMLLSIFFASLDWKEATPEFHLALLISIHQSLDFLTSQYARFGYKPHNHQNIHGMTLLAGGVLLPEMKGSAQWKELGLYILRRHAQTDFHKDGVQVENSPHYHAKVFFVFLDAYEVLKTNGTPAPETQWLEEHLQRSADFLLYMCDGSGRHVPINDSWHTSDVALLRRAAKVLNRPDLLAITGESPEKTWPPTSRAFPAAGIVSMRDRWHRDALVVILDASVRHSGHWHCGKPNLVIHAGGQPLACDPQMANYDDPSQWKYFKRADAHNTVLVDGLGDSEPSGPWSYQRLSHPRLMAFRSGSFADLAWAATDGFKKLQPPVSCERFVVFIKPHTVWVHDVLRCEQKRRYDWLLHLTPQKPQVLAESQALQTRLPGAVQFDCRPAQMSSALSGPVLRSGLHHDRSYAPQSGFWFPLQYGDLPAPVTEAPYAVWSQEASGTVTFDMVLSLIGEEGKPKPVQPLKMELPAGVTAYRVVCSEGAVTVVFDDRQGGKPEEVQMGNVALRGRVHVSNGQQWLSIP